MTVSWGVGPISFKRHRFPPQIIQHAVWLYARFTLSYRDVVDPLAERGLDVSNETIRRWLSNSDPRLLPIFVAAGHAPVIDGILMRWSSISEAADHWLWRAVDDEG